MQNLRSVVARLVIEAIVASRAANELPAFEMPEVVAERPKKPEWGDYSIAVMGLAKRIHLAPLQVAQLVAQHIEVKTPFRSVTVAPPGYLNFTLSPMWLANQVDNLLMSDGQWGRPSLGHEKRVQVEFVSANPTGPLHVGRIRGAVIGDVTANVLASCGWQVEREYYFNDAGRQMENLGRSLQLRYRQQVGQDVVFPDGDDLYQGDYLVNMAQRLVAERGTDLVDAGLTAFQEIARQEMFDSIINTLRRLNVRHDVYFREQSLYETGAVDAYLAALRNSGYTYEKDGAVWLRITDLGGAEDKVLIKADGRPTYRLPDMAYHKNKLVDRGFDLVVDVLGADHIEEWREVMYGLQALGLPYERVRLLMHQFISFKGGRMSTRKGNVVTVDDLLSDVGVDAVRFFILQRSSDTHLEFDLDLAVKESKENPVYYIQYAHTRASTILRKALNEHGLVPACGNTSLLVHPKEMAFMRRAVELDDVVALVAERLEPHHLAIYAYELARALHAFYDDPECRVLPGDQSVSPELAHARLAFVCAAKNVLARTLGLMGMSTPDSM